VGDAGSDWLNGQHGNDTLDGGGGQDHFVFGNSGAADADAVVNYASGWDDLQFDHTAFGALGAPGQFSTNDARFYAAAGAAGGHDADDRLVYNTSTGQLYYDDDGSGAHAAQLVATLQGAAPLAASDVHIF
jgi:Ca2+-binding RTX toxin-like protein